VFELLVVAGAVRRALLQQPTEQTLAHAAREHGYRSMREAGLAKAAAGETTYEEALRVTHVDAYREPTD